MYKGIVYLLHAITQTLAHLPSELSLAFTLCDFIAQSCNVWLRSFCGLWQSSMSCTYVHAYIVGSYIF